jgi:hypothetical protein
MSTYLETPFLGMAFQVLHSGDATSYYIRCEHISSMGIKPILLTLLAILYLVYLSSGAEAAEFANRPFKLTLGINEKYDDVAVYVIDQAAGTVSKKGDLIAEPYLTLSYKTHAAYPTKLILDFTADFYGKYSVQNFQTYKLIIQQKVASKTYATGKYTFIPDIFFGSEIIDIRPGTNLVPTKDQSYRTHVIQVTLDRDVAPRLNLALSGKYAVRDARPAFNYRDVNLWGGALDGIYRATPDTRLVLGASYERDNAEGGLNLFRSTLTNPVPDDATYDQFSFYSSLAYSVSQNWSIKGRFTRRERYYTTNLDGDTLHKGRREHTNIILLGTAYKLVKQIDLKASYEGIWRDSTKSYAHLRENIYMVGVDYRF